MKKIGLIGGLGPESTVDYYKLIIDAFNTQHVELAYPDIIIYSANLNEFMKIMERGNFDALTDWLLNMIEILYRAGADFAAIGSNSPHIVFEEVKRRSPLPLLSIVEATRGKAQELGLKRPGLLGTIFTMESDFYQKVFDEGGMPLTVPGRNDRVFIQEKLFSEIEMGIIKDSTREDFLSIIRKMIDTDAIDSVILGCTELPLILDHDAFSIPFLNTTAIHGEVIVNYCIEG